MKQLTLCSIQGVFRLDRVDIGDYIEAEFVLPLGNVGEFEPPHW
jgi:hypothetical protein